MDRVSEMLAEMARSVLRATASGRSGGSPPRMLPVTRIPARCAPRQRRRGGLRRDPNLPVALAIPGALQHGGEDRDQVAIGTETACDHQMLGRDAKFGKYIEAGTQRERDPFAHRKQEVGFSMREIEARNEPRTSVSMDGVRSPATAGTKIGGWDDNRAADGEIGTSMDRIRSRARPAAGIAARTCHTVGTRWGNVWTLPARRSTANW